jgi:hypothetical protein
VVSAIDAETRMTRQHSAPLLISDGVTTALTLEPLNLLGGVDAVSEAEIQMLIHAHPECLPIAEIDPMFLGAVAVCTELNTSAGPIDNLLVTPSGLPVIVECKLWRNPEGRREVVGQILDYAKELSRWSSSDLQWEVKRRLKRDGNPLLYLVRAAEPEVGEAQFNDAMTANLRRGRFLLLIVGAGIREGVEAIVEYLQAHAGLHFSLGLVELPIFVLPNGNRLVVPRVLARTAVVTRHVVAVPDGHRVEELEPAVVEAHAADAEPMRFWTEFVSELRLDDPEQPRPRPGLQGYITLTLPAPGGSVWLNVYRNMRLNEVGVTLSFTRNTAGEYAVRAIIDDWSEVGPLLGSGAHLVDEDGKQKIRDVLVAGPLDQPETRKRAFAWLAERVNTFVSVLRPRVRSAAADYQARSE